MPNPPYKVPPIHDGQELLTIIRESLRTSSQFALDGMKGELGGGIHPLDALSMIHSDLAQTLAVVKVSKEFI